MKGVLLDLDGVIYEGERPVTGAAEAVAWIRRQQIPLLFVSNTTSRPRQALVRKLAEQGIEAGPERILTPPVVARRWLEQNTAGPIALFVPEITGEEFQGLPLLAAEAEEGAAAVVVGDLGRGWDFATLNRAFRLLMAPPRPPLVALGMTRYWRALDGLRLDVAPFVAALEHAAAVEATILGKPARFFFETALDMVGTPQQQTVMVGDDLHGDVGGAQGAGMKGILVRTGKFRPEDLDEDVAPYAVLDSVAELPDWWRRQG